MSLQTWFAHNTATENPIPRADWEIASNIYAEMWPKLDHSVRYCLNPLILAAELLERAGVGEYPQVRRFNGDKGKRYDALIQTMWDTAHPVLDVRPEL